MVWVLVENFQGITDGVRVFETEKGVLDAFKEYTDFDWNKEYNDTDSENYVEDYSETRIFENIAIEGKPENNVLVLSKDFDGMYECPYADGVGCNQKKLVCDQGNFEPRCLMIILRQLNQGVNANFEHYVRDGIVMACHVLLYKDYIKSIRTKNGMKSSSDVTDEVIKIIEDLEKEGKAWYDI